MKWWLSEQTKKFAAPFAIIEKFQNYMSHFSFIVLSKQSVCTLHGIEIFQRSTKQNLSWYHAYHLHDMWFFSSLFTQLYT